MAESTAYRQRFVTVGSVRMTLQAFMVLLLGLALTTGITLAALMLRSFATLLVALLIMGLFLYSAYAMNCLVVGQCIVLSWALVAFYVVYIAVVVSRVLAFDYMALPKLARAVRR